MLLICCVMLAGHATFQTSVFTSVNRARGQLGWCPYSWGLARAWAPTLLKASRKSSRDVLGTEWRSFQ